LNPSQTRRKFIKTTFSLLAGSPFLKCTTSTEKPNIVLILLDDLGWDDLGCHGNPYVETPTIDNLAAQSVQFSQFYVNPVCAPTRASLLTGRHFLRTGVEHVHGGKDFIHLEETLLPEHFKKAGYATGMWGKWHSGHTDGYFPWERGFDEAYLAQLYQHENSRGQFNGKPVAHNAWADQVITDYAIDFMTRQQPQPFFAYLSYLTCHTPLQAPEPFIKKYENKGLSRNLATLYAMIDHLDSHLKRLFAAIEQLGLTKNTIIVFLSDNGPAISNNLLTDADREMRYVSQLKGHKGNLWENGVKSPLFVCCPEKFKPNKINRLADVTDIYPTLLDLAKIPLTNPAELDGQSLKPALAGRPELLRQRYSFNYANPGWPPTDKPWSPVGTHNEYRPVFPEEKPALAYATQIISVRNDRYKLLFNPGNVKNQVALENGYALFDILNDPREEHNLIQAKPAVFQELKARLQNWFAEIKAEKHSFNMPVFLIGQHKKVNNTIPAKGPTHISSGLLNTFNSLWHWQAGDWAEYKIKVLTPGHYKVVLQHESAAVKLAQIKISTPQNSTTSTLADHQRIEFGEIYLDENDDLLRIEVLQGEGVVIEKLYSIQLERRES